MINNGFYEFRISKYYKDPYTDLPLFEQWTSISDIGKIINNKLVTYNDYEQVEMQYLQLIKDIYIAMNSPKMTIIALEDPHCACQYPNNYVLCDLAQIIKVARDCLREKYWCILQATDLFFHFGYDYYLYIGSPIDPLRMSKMVKHSGLFFKEMSSPYNDVCIMK